jgi:hypothetical protein
MTTYRVFSTQGIITVAMGKYMADDAYDSALGVDRNKSNRRQYTNFDALPEWVQGKIARLNMLEPHDRVPGIGRRIKFGRYEIIGIESEGETL